MTGEHPETQSHYQVRFDRGKRGAAAVGVGCDVLVWADALGEPKPPALGDDVLLLIAGRGAAETVAAQILERQTRLGRRCVVAVVAAGDSYVNGDFRAAVEDDLLAGAVVNALAGQGIDFQSPEAAVVAAAAAALHRAARQVTNASVTARATTGS
ncbi:MAG: hypothetical protein Q7U41_00440 [Microbacterium sp.]|nr:hypothetical protein [Microbacterium sp.]